MCKSEELKFIGKLNINNLSLYKDIFITDEVILTNERLYRHILIYHSSEYKQLKPYLKNIVEDPDIILNDNKNNNTIILLKKLPEINKNGRVVIKIAIADDNKHPKNSIITLMKLNDRTWKQTLKNRGNIIFKKLDKNE